MFLVATVAGRNKALREHARLDGLPPVCLACMENLADPPPEPDGCTVCPECGAAGRLSLATGEPPANPP